MKSIPFTLIQSFVLSFVVVGLLNVLPATAQTPSIKGETYRNVKSNALVDDTDAGIASQQSVTACAATRLAMQTAGASLSCVCCPGGDCDDACSDSSCVACQSNCDNGSAEMPLACSYEVRATDTIPPHADCPSMDTTLAKKNEPAAQLMNSLSMNQYCSDMAELLATSVASPDVDEHSCKFAIEAALKMAVRNTEMQMDSRFEKMKARYENEMMSYRDIVNQSSAAMQSSRQVQQWMAPIYQNLDRNFQQMRLMQATNVNMDRTLSLLEQLTKKTLGDPNPPRQRITLRSPVPSSVGQPSVEQSVKARSQQAAYQVRQPVPAQESEVARLRRQVQLLEAQMYAMTQQRSNSQQMQQQQMEQQRVAQAYRQASYDMNSNVRQTSAEQPVDRLSPLRPVEEQYGPIQPLPQTGYRYYNR